MRRLPPHNSELWLVQAAQERTVQNEVSGEVRQNLQKGLPFNLRNVGTPVLKKTTTQELGDKKEYQILK